MSKDPQPRDDPRDNRRDDPRDHDPFDEWRERMREDPFLGPFFADIDREFERMRDSLSKMLQGMSEGAMDPNQDPYVYGFSMRMGPDGKPRFQEFGNVRADGPAEPAMQDVREPLVDVHEADELISITAELPGVEKQDVNVRAKAREIVLRVDDVDRRFFKRIELPTKVQPETTKATYKNGVLDIEVEKVSDPDEGTEVPVE